MLKPKPRRVLQLPIVTKRLTLRDFTTGDFAAVYHYSSDPRVTRFLFFGFPLSVNLWPLTKQEFPLRLSTTNARPPTEIGRAHV